MNTHEIRKEKYGSYCIDSGRIDKVYLYDMEGQETICDIDLVLGKIEKFDGVPFVYRQSVKKDGIGFFTKTVCRYTGKKERQLYLPTKNLKIEHEKKLSDDGYDLKEYKNISGVVQGFDIETKQRIYVGKERTTEGKALDEEAGKFNKFTRREISSYEFEGIRNYFLTYYNVKNEIHDLPF